MVGRLVAATQSANPLGSSATERFRRDDSEVEIASGEDDSRIWKVEGPAGYTMLGDLDLDGDQKPDLVVTDYRPPYHTVRAYSNKGKLLY